MNIYLIGMMGSGKSTIGKILANKIDMPFVDLDTEIEKNTGKSITEIFRNDGQDIFRAIESQQLRDVDNSVVSCGGGIIMDEKNCIIIKKNGRTILLTASMEELSNRLKDSYKRPLFSKNNIIETLTKLWLERQSQYLKTADIAVKTDGKIPQRIADEILSRLKK